MENALPPVGKVNHSHHSHHCKHGHVMEMIFHGGVREAILFDFWTVDSAPGLIFSCVIVVVVGLLNEILKFERMRLSAKYYELRKPTCPDDNKYKEKFVQNLVIAMLSSFQAALSLLIMLITMTFNLWLFMAAVLGVFLGQFYVSCKQPLIHYTDNACH